MYKLEEKKRVPKCVFMQKTEKLAMKHNPSMGNKIICHAPDFYGSFFPEKQCSPFRCKYYKKQED